MSHEIQPPAKRTKCNDYSDLDRVGNFEDLADGILVGVADFLPKTSRALFAAALTASSTSWKSSMHSWIDGCNDSPPKPSKISTIIVNSLKPSSPPPSYHLPSEYEGAPIMKSGPSNRRERLDNEELHRNSGSWEVLDFVDVHRSLVLKLSDEDLFGILICIDAVNIVKKLKLTACQQITGHGLKPLKNSKVLKQIDLCPNPKFAPRRNSWIQSPLSVSVVVPILSSIIGQEENALIHILFPEEWFKLEWEGSDGAQFEDFHSKWGNCLNEKQLCCEQDSCNNIMSDDWFDWDYLEGRLIAVCYDCNKLCCNACHDLFCSHCKKFFCLSCNPTFICAGECGRTCLECDKIGQENPTMSYQCEQCRKEFCSGCDIECQFCNRMLCWNCSPWVQCHGDSVDWGSCRKRSCRDCAHLLLTDDVEFCSDCKRYWCAECLFKEITSKSSYSCSKCKLRCFPRLLSEYTRLSQQGSNKHS